MENKHVALLMSSEEANTFGNVALSDSKQQLEYLIKQGFLLQVDWKGEEFERQIGNFLAHRATVLLPGTTPDFNEQYGKLKSEAEKGSIDIGDSIPFLLKHFQKWFKSVGLAIVLLDLGNDSYYIGLIKQNGVKELKQQSDTAWNLKIFGNQRGEVLCTVNCDCGSMNIWQVKRGEKIIDDVCQDCGKEVFDGDGNSSFQVLKEYI